MNFSGLLLGRRILLRSPLPSEEVARRINAASGSILNPLGDGIRGWSLFGWFSLHRSVLLGTNGFHPTLMGRLEPSSTGTDLRVRFGINLFAKAFLVMWYAILSLIGLAMMAALWGDHDQTGGEGVLLLVFPMFALLPVLFAYLANRNRDAKLQDLLDFLREEVGAMSVQELHG